MTLKVAYRYSLPEYLLVHCYTVPRMPFMTSAVIGVLALNLLMSVGSDQGFVYRLVIALMGTVFAFGVGTLFAIFVIVVAARSLKEQTVSLSQDGVSVASGDKETRASWATFLKLHVGSRFVFVKMDNGCHLAIPRRSFGSKGDEKAYIDFLDGKVGRP